MSGIQTGTTVILDLQKPAVHVFTHATFRLQVAEFLKTCIFKQKLNCLHKGISIHRVVSFDLFLVFFRSFSYNGVYFRSAQVSYPIPPPPTF